MPHRECYCVECVVDDYYNEQDVRASNYRRWCRSFGDYVHTRAEGETYESLTRGLQGDESPTSSNADGVPSEAPDHTGMNEVD